MMLKYFILWFPMIFIAILNGTARDLWYRKFMDELVARQISTLSLIILLGIYIFFVLKKYPPATERHSLWIGLLWVALTLAFEFGFGIFRGNTWSHLLGEYNVMKGRIWLLVAIWVFVAPYTFFKILKN